jgi:hypothetical protein
VRFVELIYVRDEGEQEDCFVSENGEVKDKFHEIFKKGFSIQDNFYSIKLRIIQLNNLLITAFKEIRKMQMIIMVDITSRVLNKHPQVYGNIKLIAEGNKCQHFIYGWAGKGLIFSMKLNPKRRQAMVLEGTWKFDDYHGTKTPHSPKR